MRKHTKPTDQLTADAPSCSLVKLRLTSFNNIHKKFRNGKTEETQVYHAIREKLRHQLPHPGCALDLKTKDLIGHL